MIKDADDRGTCRTCPRVAAAAADHRSSRAPTLLQAAAIAALIAVSCRGTEPPRIVYPLRWLDANLARTAQPAIDAWGRPRVAELPVALMQSVAVPPGYAGDVAYAEAMVDVPQLVAAVGPQSSRATLLVAPIYTERGIPLISATATSDRLGALGPWVFQLAPGDGAEGAFMVGFALDRLKARRVTVFYLDADEYGLGLRDGVVRALRLRGLAPADQVGIIPQADLPRRVAESLRRATPDVVIVAARSPETLAIARAVHAQLPRVPLGVGDGVPLSAAFARSAGGAAATMFAVAWWSPDLPDTASRAFAAAYERASGAPPSAAEAMYYDAIMVAAQAVREAGPRRSAVRRWLSELGTVRPPYHGVTGPIAFGRDRPINLLMTHVVAGAVVVVGDREAGR